MIEQEVVVQNKLGLHARPAAQLVKTAAQFKSDIYIRKNSQVVNGKSIMGVMMLAAGKGMKLTLIADGEDEKEAIVALKELFDRKFDED
jgi:phosphocarrier protein